MGREKIEPESKVPPTPHSKPESVYRPSYFGLYDGHGGSMAVDYLLATVHKNIINKETRSLFYLSEDAPVDTERYQLILPSAIH